MAELPPARALGSRLTTADLAPSRYPALGQQAHMGKAFNTHELKEKKTFKLSSFPATIIKIP